MTLNELKELIANDGGEMVEEEVSTGQCHDAGEVQSKGEDV
jgi:hypothetical protein